MKKGWKIVFTIFLIVVVIGIVGVGVGMLTGAEFTRIYSVLDDQYHIDMWLNYFAEVAGGSGSVKEYVNIPQFRETSWGMFGF